MSVIVILGGRDSFFSRSSIVRRGGHYYYLAPRHCGASETKLEIFLLFPREKIFEHTYQTMGDFKIPPCVSEKLLKVVGTTHQIQLCGCGKHFVEVEGWRNPVLRVWSFTVS